MKKSTFYTLLGCAGMAVTAGVGYGVFHIYKTLENEKSIAGEALLKAEEEREDLITKLHNCSAIDECHKTFSRYLAAEGEYKSSEHAFSEIAKKSALDNGWGELFFATAILSFFVSGAAFSKASDERRKDSLKECGEEHQKMFDAYLGGKK